MYSSENRILSGDILYIVLLSSALRTPSEYFAFVSIPQVFTMSKADCNDDAALEEISRRVYFNATVTWERVIR